MVFRVKIGRDQLLTTYGDFISAIEEGILCDFSKHLNPCLNGAPYVRQFLTFCIAQKLCTPTFTKNPVTIKYSNRAPSVQKWGGCILDMWTDEPDLQTIFENEPGNELKVAKNANLLYPLDSALSRRNGTYWFLLTPAASLVNRTEFIFILNITFPEQRFSYNLQPVFLENAPKAFFASTLQTKERRAKDDKEQVPRTAT